MLDFVWYACYGSNINRNRFMQYIRGGVAPGSTFRQVGCSEKSEPKKDQTITIPHQLYFKLNFHGWENLGVAFIEQQAKHQVSTLGRMYLVTKQQFKEIVLQENGACKFDKQDLISLSKTIEKGYSIIPSKLYSRLIYLGENEGYPIFTFTTNASENDIKYVRPGKKYLSVIIRGLLEIYPMTMKELLNYFSKIPGISEGIDEEELQSIIKDNLISIQS